MAGTNFETYSGETFSASFTCLNTEREPVDITGYTARAQVRLSPTSPVVVLDLAPTIPTPVNGVISIEVETFNVPAGIFYWDLVLDTPAETTWYIAGGTIKFRSLVTRP